MPNELEKTKQNKTGEGAVAQIGHVIKKEKTGLVGSALCSWNKDLVKLTLHS